MKKSCFIHLSLLCNLFLWLNDAVAVDAIYRYVDERGVINFTDRPPVPTQPTKKSTKISQAAQASYEQTMASVRIYKFIDTDGTIHLADRQLDTRYRLIYDGNGTLQPLAGGSYPALEVMRRKFSNYAELVKSVSLETNVEAALLHAVIQVESAYNPQAVSPKGATGLMQLMPGTAQRYGVQDRTDAVENIQGGARYLRDLLEMFNNNMELALAGYNAGENAVKRYGYQIPPYRETKDYVKRVVSLYQSYQNEM
jgi:soluble lytic murein transglycosylase-like protein